MLENIFKTILITTLVGTCIAGVLFLIKPITRKIFGGRWNYYIWVAVMLIMILPVRITIPERQVGEITPELVVESENDVAETFEITETTRESAVEELDIETEATSLLRFDCFKILSVIWLFGVIVIFIWKIIGYNVFLKKLKRDSYEEEKINVCQKTVRVMICKDVVTSPFVIGIIKPILVLPDINILKEHFENILTHEKIHIRRNDILIKWFSLIVKSVHWFNPAVYYIDKQLNTECEISCDIEAVKDMKEEEKQSYMSTILEMVSKQSTQRISVSTGMSSNKKELKTRFLMIKNKKPVKKRVVIVSLLVGFVLITAGFIIGGVVNGKIENNYELAEFSADRAENDGYNILFLGIDQGGRCDTVAVVSFKDKNITGLSIPRDVSYKTSDGYKKLSQIMAEDGDQAVFDAVKQKLSIPISYYFKTDLKAIEKVVDMFGGIEFDVPMDMEYEDPHQSLRINIKKGKQHLTGEQVRGLLQYRRGNSGGGYVNGDLGRIQLGQNFVRDFITQNIKNLDSEKVKEIINIIAKSIITNIPERQFVELMECESVQLYTIPGYTIEGATGELIYEIDHFSSKELLKPFISDLAEQSFVYKQDAMIKNLVGEDYEVLVNSGMEGTVFLDKDFLGSDECGFLNSFFNIELGHNFGITVNVLSLALWNEKAETNAGCAFIYHENPKGDIKVIGEKMLTYQQLQDIEKFIATSLF